MRSKIERGAFGEAGMKGGRQSVDAQMRSALSHLSVRQSMARAMAGDDKRAYNNAMQQLRRYASGKRGAGVPEDLKRRVVEGARKLHRSAASQKIRKARRVRVRMVTDATVSAKSRDNFGPGYSGAGYGAEINPEVFAEALDRGDTWSIMAMAYEDYWPGSSDTGIHFEDVQDVEIIIDE
jgi:hypothetical protein